MQEQSSRQGLFSSTSGDNKRLSISDDYDVVILGAGVSGLLLASELSRTARVLVLERDERALEKSFWITTEEPLARNKNLALAADLAFQSMDFIGIDGTTYRCEGEYRLWNTSALIESLLQCTVENGASVTFGQSICSYKRSQDCLTIITKDRNITAHLVIDCMGYQSPIITAEGCGDVLGYYLLYSATFAMTGALAPVALHNLTLNTHAAYVEAFPTSDGHLHIVLIVPERQLRWTRDLKADFDFITRESTYSRFIVDASEHTFLGEIIPVVRLRRRAFDHLIFYGEAGQVHPAATGTESTRMLLNYRDVAMFLRDLLARDRLSARDLAKVPGPANRTDQLTLFRDTLCWSSHRFRNIVTEAGRLGDHALINQLFFGSVGEGGIGVVRTVKTLVKAQSWTLLSAFANGLARSATV